MPEGDFRDHFDLKEVRLPRSPDEMRSVRKVAGYVVIGILVLIFLVTSFYTIEPEEVGIILRLGKYVRSSDPGLHFKAPFGFERVTKVPVQRQLKQEFGFRTLRAGVRSQYSTGGFKDESNMLTGDLNAAVVEWVVQYRIVDPYKYLFRVRNVENTFRDISEAVMRRVVGDRTVNEVLTIGRQQVADQVLQQIQDLCDQYETGIKVEQVVLQDVNPPDPVKPSFNEVNEAQQEKERLINEAQSEYNKVIPRARGEAEQTIRQAEGYAVDRVNRARGDSARFVAFYESYRRAPEVTRKRVYLETMNEVLPKVRQKVIVDDDLKSVLPLLNLNPAQPGKEGAD
jgi:membrane protease subunit HflK